MSIFKQYITCTKCSHSEEDAYQAKIHNSTNVNTLCTSCGSIGKWEDESKKWVSNSIWYKPKTWGTGYWVYSSPS